MNKNGRVTSHIENAWLVDPLKKFDELMKMQKNMNTNQATDKMDNDDDDDVMNGKTKIEIKTKNQLNELYKLYLIFINVTINYGLT